MADRVEQIMAAEWYYVGHRVYAKNDRGGLFVLSVYGDLPIYDSDIGAKESDELTQAIVRQHNEGLSK